MSKWRPSPDSGLYVIPDIHGEWGLLQNVLKRILPLRKNKQIEDRVVLLGNFIGRSNKSLTLLKELIKIKEKYPDRFTFVLGENEWRFREVLLNPSAKTYIEWIEKGGGLSMLSSYIEENEISVSHPMEIDHYRLQSLVPEEHKRFIFSLVPFAEIDNYIFVHKGCDPLSPLQDQNVSSLVLDQGLWELAYETTETFTQKTVVMGGHKVGPWISPSVIMLDGSSQNRLPVMELNSFSVYEARKGQNRMVKLDARVPKGSGYKLISGFNKRFGKNKDKILDI